jgi:hypothetical protein
MLMLLQQTTAEQTTGAAGQTSPEQSSTTPTVLWVVALFLIAAIVVMIFLVVRTGVGRRTLPQGERSWLDYGNLYVVSFGIAACLIGFLVILLSLGLFESGVQALGFLTALFGVITGLVGTYFGVKQSADARQGAENLASGATNTTPTVTITPAEATVNAGDNHTVTVTVTSVDGTPAANVPVTLTITDGPDVNHTDATTANPSGQASFTFQNNGNPGTDTIEAASLGGKGTATVTFQ